MTEVVPQDLNINEKIAREAIGEAFDLSINSLELIGEGWDNLVYLINKKIIFRFSRRKVGIPLLERERRVLKGVAKHLTLEAPYPEYLSEGTKSYPHPFYGHQKIQGSTGCSVNLREEQFRAAAVKLAEFLKKLHSLDISQVKSPKDSMEGFFDRAEALRMRKAFNERLKAVEPFYDFSTFKEKIYFIQEQAKPYEVSKDKRSFVHGDLYHRHLIFSDDGSLSGIIDWGDCCITDPVVDLAVLFQFFPYVVHKDFFKIYGGISESEYAYAKFLGLYYAVAMLWYGHDRKDQRLIQGSLQTLKNI